MYEGFSSLIPKKVYEAYKKEIIYNGLKIRPEKFIGFLFYFGLLGGIGAGLILNRFFKIDFLVTFIVFFLSTFILAFVLMRLKSESKGRIAENVLPDALQLVAANMKSGLTTERALFVAARPEFGPIQVELLNASKRISTGERVEKALLGISEAINSTVVEKTMWLISEGIKSGAQMADLLYQLSDDLKNEQAIKEEIKANISIYVILIIFAASIGGPLLFGVSSFIVQVLTTQISKTPEMTTSKTTGQSNMQGNLSLISQFASGKRKFVSIEFIIQFSVIMLIMTSFFASLTIGVINTGKEINGVKMIIPMIIISLIIFYSTRAVLLSVFKNLIT
jgi:flagellar protein FlaJ